MTTQALSDGASVETPGAIRESLGFLEVEGAQLHCVHHHARGASRGAVILCGSIGAERERAYRTLVEMARAMAHDGFDAVRFDYRGIGESTGRFEEHCLADWRHDVEACIRWVREGTPEVPVGLWGVRAGALLAAEIAAAGEPSVACDGVMLHAPLDGRPLLESMLRSSLVADMVGRPGAKRSTREQLVERMERGEQVLVDGYAWTSRLWSDAASHLVVPPEADDPRPWRLVDFRGAPKAVAASGTTLARDLESGPRFWESSRLLHSRSPTLLDRTRTWLRDLAAARRQA